MCRPLNIRKFVFATLFLLFHVNQATLLASPQEEQSNRAALQKVLLNPGDFVIVANSLLRGKGTHEIYHVDNLKEPVATIFGYSASPMPVIGAEDLFVDKNLPTFKNGLARGLPSVYRGMGNKLDSVYIDNFQDYFLSRDLIHCVKVKDGDVWLGRIDWGKGEFVENKITTDGSFGDSWPNFQSGRFVYLLNKDKTFTKVNVRTEEVENVSLIETSGQQFYSPDMRAMVNFTDDQITVVDLQTGEKRQLPNTINYSHPTDPNAAKTRPFELFDVGHTKRTMLWVSPRLIVAPNHGGLSILNLETAKSDFLPVAGDYSEFSWEYHSSHRWNELACTTIDGIVIAKMVNKSVRNSTPEWFEVDPIKRTKTRLDIVPWRATWLTRTRFFHEINKKGEDQDGIRYEQTSPRLSVKLHDRSRFHQYSQPYFHHQDSEQLFFNRGYASGAQWSVCDLKTGEITRLEKFNSNHKQIGVFLPPVDLGLTGKDDSNEPIVSIFKNESASPKVTAVAKPSQNKSSTLAYEFCVRYDRKVLADRARRKARTPEEMTVLTPLFVEVAKQFSSLRASKKELRRQKHLSELPQFSQRNQKRMREQFQMDERYADDHLSGIEFTELSIEVWKVLRKSDLSPNPKQYLGVPHDVVKGVEQCLDELRQLHDSGKRVEFVGVLFGQPITPSDLERAKTDRRFYLPRRLRDVAESDDSITQLRFSLDEVDLSKARYSKSNSTVTIGNLLNFRLQDGKWVLFNRSGR